MGGINSTPGVEQHLYDELQSKYNRMKGNYETEKLVSQSLKDNIENLEKKIVDLEINLENINNDNNKVIEALKSNYESDLINKENTIIKLEDLLEENKKIIEENMKTIKEYCEINEKNKEIQEKKEEIQEKNNKTIEDLRDRNIKLTNENKNIKFLENKYRLLEESCITQENTIDELKYNLKTNSDLMNSKEEENKKITTYEVKLIEMQNDNNELKNVIELQEKNQNILNKKICSIVNTLDYFKTNKTEVIEDILKRNNTILPDFMERNIIQNIYSYIIDKLDLLITV